MRVYHLIKGLGRGGAETLLAQTHPFRREGDVYSFGYFLPWKDALVAELRAQGADVKCFEARSAAACLAKLPRVIADIRKFRPDVIHTHLPIASVVGRLAAKALGVPVVGTEHNLQERYHRITRAASFATWRLQSHVICVSHQVQESIDKQTPGRVPTTVVSNGIPTDTYRPAPELGADVRREYGIPLDARVVGTVAVFSPKKRFDVWLEAAESIAAQIPDVHFLLVGDGPSRADLESWVDQRGLRQRTHFAGLQDKVRPFMNAMDLNMMSSDFEGLPIALLESMSSGVVPVCTSVGGIPEVLPPEHLVERRNPAALASLACEWLHNDERRQDASAAMRRVVVEQFDTRRMVHELETIYDDVCA